MDNLTCTELQRVKVKRPIFIVALICFFFLFIIGVGSVFSEFLSSTDNAIFYRVAYLIDGFCYALLIACFAKYMKILNFKLEQIFSYILAAFIFVSVIIFFVISLYLELNAGNDGLYYYTWMYSVFAMFANIIRTLSMIALGISLIVRKGNNVEGLKVVGFLCLFSVLLNFGAYLFQMIGMNMETYYGVFGDYKIVVFITSILYILANLLFAGGIVYFLLKSNQKYKYPKFDMSGLN